MWTELEQNHDIDLIIKMEDDLKLKNTQVEDLLSENETKGRIVDNKNVIINGLNKYDENQGKIDQLANMIADAGVKYKKMRHTSLQDDRQQKVNHATAIKMEEQIKKLATLIRAEKQK